MRLRTWGEFILPALPTYDLLLFDLDGTLVDSAPDLAAAIDATLAELGLPPVGPQRIRPLVGEGATRLVEQALVLAGPPGDSIDVASAVARFREHYRRALVVETRAYPGVPDLLERLGGGPSLGVVTNKPGDMARPILDALGLRRHFASVIGDGDGYPRKPAPAAALAIAASIGVPARRILVVGDGLPDLALARALGCDAAGVTWGYVPRADLAAAAPRFLVDKTLELLDIMGV